jgi:hypothetical protein
MYDLTGVVDTAIAAGVATNALNMIGGKKKKKYKKRR